MENKLQYQKETTLYYTWCSVMAKSGIRCLSWVCSFEKSLSSVHVQGGHGSLEYAYTFKKASALGQTYF